MIVTLSGSGVEPVVGSAQVEAFGTLLMVRYFSTSVVPATIGILMMALSGTELKTTDPGGYWRLNPYCGLVKKGQLDVWEVGPAVG